MYPSQNFVEKPIRLISVNSLGKLVLHFEGVAFLKTISSPIAVLSIAGPYRTGKSYLLNSLLSSQNAFKVGNTTNESTHGLWIWSKPILATNSEGKVTSVVVIDSEGFANLQGTHDKRIVTLALLISSCFLYNSKGAIDKDSLFDLEFIIEIARSITNPSHQTNNCDFHWILRDFHLSLVNQLGTRITPTQYMENCFLQAQSKVSQRTIETLKTYFPYRDCHCIVRPNLSKQTKEIHEERPQFLQSVIELRKIFKKIKSFNMDGSSFTLLLESYIDAMNSGQNLEKVFQQGYDCRVRLDCLQKLNGELKVLQSATDSQILPDFQERLIDIKSELKEFYKQRMCSHKQIQFLDDQLEDMIQEFQQQNSKRVCSISSVKFVERRSSQQISKPKQKSVRISLNLSEQNKMSMNNQVRRQSYFRQDKEKSIKQMQTKIQDYEAKVHRKQLEIECTLNQFTLLKEQNQKLKKDCQTYLQKNEQLSKEFFEKEKDYQQKMEQLQQKCQLLKKQLKISKFQNDKIKILTSQKIEYLQKELRQFEKNKLFDLQQKEKIYQLRLSEYLKEIEELKHQHQSQINQVKEIYKAKTLQKSDVIAKSDIIASVANYSQNFFTDFKNQLQIIDNLKEEAEKSKYTQLQLENQLKNLKTKLQIAEERSKETVDQLIKRSKETQANLQSLMEHKLQIKDSLIGELSQKISQTVKENEQKQRIRDIALNQHEKVISNLKIDKQNLNFAITTLNQTIETAKKENNKLQEIITNKQEQVTKLQLKNNDLQTQSITQELKLAKLANQLVSTKIRLQQEQQKTQTLDFEIKTHFQTEKSNKQTLKEVKDKLVQDIKHIYELEKGKLEQKIEFLTDNTDKLKKYEYECQELKKQILFKDQQIEKLEQELEENQKNYLQKRQALLEENKELRKDKEDLTEYMNNIKTMLQSKYEQILQEFKNNQKEQNQKYYELLTEAGNKDKELYILKDHYNELKRKYQQLEHESKQRQDEYTKYKIQSNLAFKKEVQKLKLEKTQILATERQNKNKLALLNQKNQFLGIANAKTVEHLEKQYQKEHERGNKVQEHYKDLLLAKEKEILEIQKLSTIHENDKLVLAQNLQQMFARQKASELKYQNHLHLFQGKLEEMKAKNAKLSTNLEQYKRKYEQILKVKELLTSNYDKDYKLWTNKLQIALKSNH